MGPRDVMDTIKAVSCVWSNVMNVTCKAIGLPLSPLFPLVSSIESSLSINTYTAKKDFIRIEPWM